MKLIDPQYPIIPWIVRVEKEESGEWSRSYFVTAHWQHYSASIWMDSRFWARPRALIAVITFRLLRRIYDWGNWPRWYVWLRAL